MKKVLVIFVLIVLLFNSIYSQDYNLKGGKEPHCIKHHPPQGKLYTDLKDALEETEKVINLDIDLSIHNNNSRVNEIYKLKNLEYLVIRNLTGTIPKGIFQLKELTSLKISWMPGKDIVKPNSNIKKSKYINK